MRSGKTEADDHDGSAVRPLELDVRMVDEKTGGRGTEHEPDRGRQQIDGRS